MIILDHTFEDAPFLENKHAFLEQINRKKNSLNKLANFSAQRTKLKPSFKSL